MSGKKQPRTFVESLDYVIDMPAEQFLEELKKLSHDPLVPILAEFELIGDEAVVVMGDMDKTQCPNCCTCISHLRDEVAYYKKREDILLRTMDKIAHTGEAIPEHMRTVWNWAEKCLEQVLAVKFGEDRHDGC